MHSRHFKKLLEGVNDDVEHEGCEDWVVSFMYGLSELQRVNAFVITELASGDEKIGDFNGDSINHKPVLH